MDKLCSNYFEYLNDIKGWSKHRILNALYNFDSEDFIQLQYILCKEWKNSISYNLNELVDISYNFFRIKINCKMFYRYYIISYDSYKNASCYNSIINYVLLIIYLIFQMITVLFELYIPLSTGEYSSFFSNYFVLSYDHVYDTKEFLSLKYLEEVAKELHIMMLSKSNSETICIIDSMIIEIIKQNNWKKVTRNDHIQVILNYLKDKKLVSVSKSGDSVIYKFYQSGYLLMGYLSNDEIRNAKNIFYQYAKQKNESQLIYNEYMRKNGNDHQIKYSDNLIYETMYREGY